MVDFQFWKITIHGRILLHLKTNISARSNDFPLETSESLEHIMVALNELQSDGFVTSEFREVPIGDHFYLTSKGKHIANVLHHSVQVPLSKADRSIQHLLK